MDDVTRQLAESLREMRAAHSNSFAKEWVAQMQGRADAALAAYEAAHSESAGVGKYSPFDLALRCLYKRSLWPRETSDDVRRALAATVALLDVPDSPPALTSPDSDGVPIEDTPGDGSIIDALNAIHAAGGSAWDDVDDEETARLIGRDSPSPQTVILEGVHSASGDWAIVGFNGGSEDDVMENVYLFTEGWECEIGDMRHFRVRVPLPPYREPETVEGTIEEPRDA